MEPKCFILAQPIIFQGQSKKLDGFEPHMGLI